MIKKNKICVFCGASIGSDPIYINAARKAGKIIGENNFDFVFGGGSVGLMGEAARSAQKFGSKVHGVIPKFLTKNEIPLRRINLTITKTMRTRKAKMYKISSMFIVLPGGIGTLDELVEILTLIQLKQIQNKPVLLLNINGLWDPILVMFKKMINEGFLNKNNLIHFTDLNNVAKLNSFIKSF